jgi:hypothetical protein
MAAQISSGPLSHRSTAGYVPRRAAMQVEFGDQIVGGPIAWDLLGWLVTGLISSD